VIKNMLSDHTELGYLPGDYLIIQSDGKMWCGYENFIEYLRELSAFLSDVKFYIGDEEGYIDEFIIQTGVLYYKLLRSDWQMKSLEEFLALQAPE